MFNSILPLQTAKKRIKRKNNEIEEKRIKIKEMETELTYPKRVCPKP
jgi:hypothetical protein